MLTAKEETFEEIQNTTSLLAEPSPTQYSGIDIENGRLTKFQYPSEYSSMEAINPRHSKGKRKCNWLREQIPPPVTWLISCYALLGSGFEIMSVSWIAWYTDLPFIFPSLGATTFLHFAIPDQPAASPRNTLLGHLIGGLCGYAGLVIFGLEEEPVVFVRDDNHIVMQRVGTLTFAIATTCFLMVLLNLAHPPAGATTIIVALGILRTVEDLTVLMIANLMLCVETWLLTKIFRHDIDYPYWSFMTKSQQHPANIEEDPRVYMSQLTLKIMSESQHVPKSTRKVFRFQRQLTSRLVVTPRTT